MPLEVLTGIGPWGVVARVARGVFDTGISGPARELTQAEREFNPTLTYELADMDAMAAGPVTPTPVYIPPASTPTMPPPVSPIATVPPPVGSPPVPQPTVTIWEDPAEWTGERRSAPPRIPMPGRPAPVFEGKWERPTPPPTVGVLGGVIGRAIGGVLGGILWPAEMGSGELTPEQRREGEERWKRSEEAKAAEEAKRRLDQQIRDLEAARAHNWPGRYHRPLPEGVYMPEPMPLPDVAPLPTPAPVHLPPPIARPTSRTTPASSSAPSTQSPPRSVSQPQPVTSTPSFPWATVATAIGSALLSRSRMTVPRAYSWPSSSASSWTGPPSSVGDPITSSLTGAQSQVLGSTPPRIPTQQQTDQDRCRQQRKKREKKRECRARAQLAWRSGPKKGQLAGTRCFSWNDLR